MFFFFSSRRRHTSFDCDWSSDVCSSDLEMRRDERVIVMGEDVGIKGGVFKATDGLFKEFGEMRVIDTPLAESGIVGVEIGRASCRERGQMRVGAESRDKKYRRS